MFEYVLSDHSQPWPLHRSTHCSPSVLSTTKLSQTSTQTPFSEIFCGVLSLQRTEEQVFPSLNFLTPHSFTHALDYTSSSGDAVSVQSPTHCCP